MNKKEYLIKYFCENNCTHLFMNGGKINVKNTQEFHEDYLESIKSGVKLSVVEKVPQLSKFKMFLDIDNKEPLDNVQDFLINILHYFDHKCVICLSNGSHGIHIIFQNFLVSQDEAKIIADKIPSCFNIDKSVYNTGLRMVFSQKKNLSKYYIPKYIWTGKLISLDNFDVYNTKILDTCSIIPNVIINVERNLQFYNKLDKTKNLKHKIYNLSYIHEKYTDISFTKISKINNFYIINTDSNYCTNINDYHKNAYIYFIINCKKIYQKCFCKCSNKSCSSYIGKKYNVSHVLYNEIKALNL